MVDSILVDSQEFCVMLLQVLHMDRNDYYGGDSTSLNLNQARTYNKSMIFVLFDTETCTE
jgi:RAB protein geranylgeranyltransferase component A